MRWSSVALDCVKDGTPWVTFHDVFPEYSYDAWEVKRRRVDVAEPPLISVAEAPVGEYVVPMICYWDLETTYSTQPRLLS